MLRLGFKAEANRVAIRVRQSLGLSAIDPIDPVMVCCQFDIKLLKLSDVTPNCSEFLVHNQSAFSAMTLDSGLHRVIVYNDSHHPYRVNSDICHELAHCFLGHPVFELLAVSGDRTHVKKLEEEASCLSGNLLMTNEACIHVVKNNLQSTAQFTYGVSKKMLKFRLQISGAQIMMK